MRVLQVNQVVRVTSTGRIVENIGDYLLDKGHESFIAYSGRPENTSNSVLYQISNKLDSNLHALGTRLFDKHGLYSKKVTKDFIKWIIAIEPDVIHLHNIHGYYLNYPVFFEFLKESKIPVCWTFHDFWPVTGHCTYFSDVACEKWLSLCQNCPKLKYYPASLWWDNSKANFKLKKENFGKLEYLNIIAISKWSRELIEKSFLGKKNINSIPNGIDSSIFKPVYIDEKNVRKKFDLDNRKILIALATTWGARKGYQDYIKLSQQLRNDFQIVMVGLQGKLAQNLPPNIKALGRTDSLEDLAELYNLAEITLNLSYQETFGLTTVEGLMCGTPAIVYDVTASPELVRPSTGIAVKPGDIDAVIRAINEIEEKGGKSSFSHHCRKYAVNNFDINSVHDSHLYLYSTLT
jgi:glycosyltransferase involved in cell wall biosynthesis